MSKHWITAYEQLVLFYQWDRFPCTRKDRRAWYLKEATSNGRCVEKIKCNKSLDCE